jgi:hypothetical protein
MPTRLAYNHLRMEAKPYAFILSRSATPGKHLYTKYLIRSPSIRKKQGVSSVGTVVADVSSKSVHNPPTLVNHREHHNQAHMMRPRGPSQSAHMREYLTYCNFYLATRQKSLTYDPKNSRGVRFSAQSWSLGIVAATRR